MRRFATLGKDPTVRTDFLPDKDRQRAEEELREQLKKEWALRQVGTVGGWARLKEGRRGGWPAQGEAIRQPGCGWLDHL